MRLVCLAGFLFALLAMVPSRGDADVLRLMFAAADDQAGGTPPPQQSPNLTSWAGEARATTLPELLQISVRQSPALQSAKLDIAIAEARIQQTWARNDWLIGAKVSGSERIVGTGRSFDGTADLTRALPTGGTVNLHVDSQYNDDLTGKRSIHSVAGSITQPLLRGRG